MSFLTGVDIANAIIPELAARSFFTWSFRRGGLPLPLHRILSRLKYSFTFVPYDLVCVARLCLESLNYVNAIMYLV